MTTKRLEFDFEHGEVIVNGNRLSQLSLLNLLSVGLFYNLYGLAIETGKVVEGEAFVLTLDPSDFERWLFEMESNGVALRFSYLEDKDKYVIGIGDDNDESLHDREE